MTLDNLRTIMPNCKHPELFIDHINEVFKAYGWDEIPIQAAFLGQIAHESQELNALSENCNYSPQFLMKFYNKKFLTRSPFDFKGKPEKIANIIYANRFGNGNEASGDGYRYRARGGIGITWKFNYEKIKELLGIDCVNHPEMLEEPEWAIKASAAFFKWQKLDQLALKNDLDALTKKVNVAALGADKRDAYTIKAARVLGGKWNS